MEINDLLALCQREHIILQPRGQRITLWRAGQPIPRGTREAIRRYRRELLSLIAQSDIAVCPSRSLHRQYWTYVGQHRYVCVACQMLNPCSEKAG